MHIYADGVNLALDMCRTDGISSNFDAQKSCYEAIRGLGLGANTAIRAGCAAISLIRADKEHKKAWKSRMGVFEHKRRHLKPGDRGPKKPTEPRPSVKAASSIDYDQRTLSIKGDCVSIWTAGGRIKDVWFTSHYDVQDLKSFKQATLFKRGRSYFLSLVVDVDVPEAESDGTFLGVDLGICTLAATSEGDFFFSDQLWEHKKKRLAVRGSLQKKGTRGVKRVLKRLSLKESRHTTKINHEISKKIVYRAKSLKKGIRLEDLSGIRITSKIGGETRKRLHGWSFFQLKTFIEYKAALAAVPYEEIDASYTSQTCSACGHRDKRSRKSQSEFVCTSCGNRLHADLNAALNISNGGAVSRPEAILQEPVARASVTLSGESGMVISCSSASAIKSPRL